MPRGGPRAGTPGRLSLPQRAVPTAPGTPTNPELVIAETKKRTYVCNSPARSRTHKFPQHQRQSKHRNSPNHQAHWNRTNPHSRPAHRSRNLPPQPSPVAQTDHIPSTRLLLQTKSTNNTEPTSHSHRTMCIRCSHSAFMTNASPRLSKRKFDLPGRPDSPR